MKSYQVALKSYTIFNKPAIFIVISVVLLAALFYRYPLTQHSSYIQSSIAKYQRIKLPPPALTSNTSIEEALNKRRSVRNFKNDSLSMQEIAQLLWASQGVTAKDGGRTAPSAGALYPLEIYLVSNEVKELRAGIYHYLPGEHSLEVIATGDSIGSLFFAAKMQGSVKRGAGVIVITANYSHTTKKYGDRGVRFVQLEAGHAAQNICLQAVSLNIGTVTVGAFDDAAVGHILNLPEKTEPLYIMPIGKNK